MMREVLTRRFSRLMKEGEDAKAKRPDLVLIDGGPGQLSMARQVFADLGVEDVALVGISKGAGAGCRATSISTMPGKAPFRLDQKSPVLYYLQRLRDEAHRFAIGSHRKKRLRRSAPIPSTRSRASAPHENGTPAAFRLGPGGGQRPA